MILYGPDTKRRPDSRAFKQTTRFPRNRPARRIRTVPGVIDLRIRGGCNFHVDHNFKLEKLVSGSIFILRNPGSAIPLLLQARKTHLSLRHKTYVLFSDYMLSPTLGGILSSVVTRCGGHGGRCLFTSIKRTQYFIQKKVANGLTGVTCKTCRRDETKNFPVTV